MTGPSPEQAATVRIDDLVLAKIVARAAVTTPGVARLQPQASRIVGRAATSMVQRAATRNSEPAGPADHDAVHIERDDGTVRLAVRLVATGQPPVIEAANDVLRRIAEDLQLLADTTADICIQIVDIEPPDSPEWTGSL